MSSLLMLPNRLSRRQVVSQLNRRQPHVPFGTSVLSAATNVGPQQLLDWGTGRLAGAAVMMAMSNFASCEIKGWTSAESGVPRQEALLTVTFSACPVRVCARRSGPGSATPCSDLV